MTTKILLLSCLIGAFLLGCQEEDQGSTNATHLDASHSDIEVNDGGIDTGSSKNENHVFLIRILNFAREQDGQSLGFDLDEAITEQGGESGCGHLDFETPDGQTGVDNQFSQLLPLIEQFGGMAISTYGQTAITSGNLLLMFELSGVDDLENDDAVTMSIYRGLGAPLLGTDDLVEPWQTFDIDVDTHRMSTQDARIVDGVLVVNRLDFTFPFYIFDFVFEITLKNARFAIDLREDARHEGLLAGSVTLENMLQIADNIEGGDMLPGLIRNIGTTLADMDPDSDGVCQALSTTMSFQTVGAFFYEDSPRPPSAD